MGRVKAMTRKRGGHTEDSMKRAVELIKAGMSIRKASQECQLKYPTVRLYMQRIKENGEENVRLTPNYEVNKIFTSQQEEKLIEYIDYCALIFHGLSTKNCRRVAYQMAIVNDVKIPQSWIDSKMAGIEWLRSFRKRHPEFSLRKAEGCSIARATAFNKHNVDSFFSNLKSVMERHPSFSDGTRLYNLDETSTTTVQRPGKVLARKGTNVAKVTSGERGTLVTTCCIVSAIGQALPPAMVFPRKKFQPHMLQGAPPGTLGLAAASGWMNGEIFVDVMKHFIKHVSASKENPALLIMDNHESHLSIEALDLAKSSGVTILTLHPHTTAKLQPLDVGLNGPFKSYYNSAVDSWLMRNPGRPLTIYNVAECVGTAYLKSMTPINIVHAFKKCGIFPFDDEIFTEADFLPSTVTDRPLIGPINREEECLLETENSDPQNLNDDYRQNHEQEIRSSSISPSLLQDANPSTSQVKDHTPPTLEVADFHPSCLIPNNNHQNFDLTPNVSNSQPPNQTEYNRQLNIDCQPTPSTSRKFISPMEFMSPIKAKPRNPKRRRAPGKSMIATDTPEKNALAEKKKKATKQQTKKVKQDLFTKDKIQKKASKNKKKGFIIENNDTSDEEIFVASGSSSGGEEFISDSEDDEGKVMINGNFLPLSRDPKEQEFVVVLFPMKKISVYYVAKIIETIDDNDDESDFFVSFLRLKNRTRQTFCEPLVPDTAGIQIKDIKYILPNPKITGSSRRQASYSFGVYFDMAQLNLR